VERHELTLWKLAIADDAYISALLAHDSENLAASRLDHRTHGLVRLGALIAIDAPAASYLGAVESARDCGISDEEVVGCLIATLPALGVARVVSAAPKLGLALGYDVGAALEARSSD
jgi:4-carboxymuconolactone decarboxylase